MAAVSALFLLMVDESTRATARACAAGPAAAPRARPCAGRLAALESLVEEWRARRCW
jgi:hypothetical protein